MAGSSFPCFMTGYVLLLAFWHPYDPFTQAFGRLDDQVIMIPEHDFLSTLIKLYSTSVLMDSNPTGVIAQL